MVNRKLETASEVIRVTPTIKIFLDMKGKKGDSYDDIIKRLFNEFKVK